MTNASQIEGTQPRADAGYEIVEAATEVTQESRIAELEIENERLREFITQIRASAKMELDDAAERIDWHRRTVRNLDRRLRTNRANTAKLRRRVVFLEGRIKSLTSKRSGGKQATKKPQSLKVRIRRTLGRAKRAVVGK